MTLELLKLERAKLEMCYAAQRSILDRLIHKIQAAAQQERDPALEVAQSTPPPQPSASVPPSAQPKPQGRGARQPAKARRRRSNGTQQSRLLDWIMRQKGEFRRADAQRELSLTVSACSCALNRLKCAGRIKHLARGRWIAIGATANKVESEYQRFRESAHIAAPPEIKTSLERTTD